MLVLAVVWVKAGHRKPISNSEVRMIGLTRLNHLAFMLNPDRIVHVESTPDTVVVMDNGERFMVLETADQLVEKVVEFRRRIGVPGVRADEGSL